MRKETVYYMPYDTAEEIAAARELKQDLYQEFNDVQLYFSGLHEVRIVAQDEIIKNND